VVFLSSYLQKTKCCFESCHCRFPNRTRIALSMIPFHEGYRPAPEVPQSPAEYVLRDFPKGSDRGVKLSPVPSWIMSGGVSLFPLYITTSSTTHPAFSSSTRTGGTVIVSLSYVLMAIRTESKLKLRSDKRNMTMTEERGERERGEGESGKSFGCCQKRKYGQAVGDFACVRRHYQLLDHNRTCLSVCLCLSVCVYVPRLWWPR
jgi:hypothetical protein